MHFAVDNGWPDAYYIRMHPRERLRDWIVRSKVTQREAAKILGLDHTLLNQILSGRRKPGLANAFKIERVTGIAAGAWVPPTDGASAQPDAAVAVTRK